MFKRRRQTSQIDFSQCYCFVCSGSQDLDQQNKRRRLLTCFECKRNVHAYCYQVDTNGVRGYPWKCRKCKDCCICLKTQKKQQLITCQYCDRGYHRRCVNPPLKTSTKDWYCDICSSMPKAQPLASLSDNTRNSSYKLRKTPTHSVKFIENTEMVNETRKKRKEEENHQTAATEPLKLRLTIVKKRGRPAKTIKDEKEDDDFFRTFGHKITKSEANTKRGTPTDIDILYFEKAKLKIEHKTTIEQKRHDIQTVPKIRKILFNSHLIDTWYVAPYPEEYSQSSILYICEYCMKYMKSSYIASRHRIKCKVFHPPGDEIYRDGKLSIFEVDGRKNKMYCQNLCLMAKMFLDHKTLYYDVEPFLFYIMTEADEQGCHFVGYFSKEKRSSMNYNVSCILTMPIFQRKGYGQFLIDFSYLLSKTENKTGSPERPLSDLGLLSYRSYWKNTLFRELAQLDQAISIEELCNKTSLTADDIISTLQNNNMIQHDKETNKYTIVMDIPQILSHLQNVDKKNYISVDPEKLTWTPFILSKDRLAPLLNTIKDADESNDVCID